MKTIKRINAGGFGLVEKVQLDDGTEIARKTFRPVRKYPPEALEKLRKRFVREVKYQRELDPEFFIEILDSDLEADEPWFTMPLADRSYREQINDDRATNRISEKPLADLFNALEALHANDIVHRDLKPDNILFHDGRWKISDFGLVLPPPEMTAPITGPVSGWGTAEYMAPEQSVGMHAVTAAADIYAVGCILHDLVSGEQRVPLAQHTAPGPIGDVISRCTEQAPNRRFKSVRGLRAAVFDALKRQKMAPPSPEMTEWVELLSTLGEWKEERLRDFAKLLGNGEYELQTDSPLKFEKREALFDGLKEEQLEYLLTDAPQPLGRMVVSSYLGWVLEPSGWWSYGYCDVLGNRLEKIFEHGDKSIKAEAIVAAANLGCERNRWSLMRLVVRLCGADIHDDLAKRIAMEINAGDHWDAFEHCASRRGCTPGDSDQNDEAVRNAYHPLIGRTIPRIAKLLDEAD